MRFFCAVILLAFVATSYAKRPKPSEACREKKMCEMKQLMEQININPLTDMEIIQQAGECAKTCMEAHKAERENDPCRPDHDAIKQCMDDKGFAKPDSSEEDGEDEGEEAGPGRRGPGGRRGNGPRGEGPPGGRRGNGPRGEGPPGGRRGGRGGKHMEKQLAMLPYANEMMDKVCPEQKEQVKACLAGLNNAAFNPDTYTQEKRNQIFVAMCNSGCDAEGVCEAEMKAAKAERKANRPEQTEEDRAARKQAMCECATAAMPEGQTCETPRPCQEKEDDGEERKDKWEVKDEMCAAGEAPTFEQMMKHMHKRGGKHGGKHGGRGGRHH